MLPFLYFFVISANLVIKNIWLLNILLIINALELYICQTPQCDI